MKKKYEKPVLMVETFKLDLSIAGSNTCTDQSDQALQFQSAYEAWLNFTGKERGPASLEEYLKSLKMPTDTYCYHTMTNSLFNS